MIRNVPSCDIAIDKEGTWYYRGAEMTRREIVNFFYENLKMDANGCYLIELPGEQSDGCYVEVEDTAFVVRAVRGRSPEQSSGIGISIDLSDGSVEELDPSTLQIAGNNVLYCSVKQGGFPARFSRAGYYQLAENIEYDDVKEDYFLSLNDRRYYIKKISNRE